MELIGITRGVSPGQTTIHTLLVKLAPGDVEAALAKCVCSLSANSSLHIAIDGKSVKASACSEYPALHLLSAFCSSFSSVLYQRAVDGRQNEISGTYDLLDNIPVKGNVISGDAIFCQKGLCSRIVEREGDFMFVVKGNQKVLFSVIQKTFPLGPEYFDRATAKSMDKAHGRFESRYMESVEHMVTDWPETRQIFHIVRHREYKAQCSEEHIYGITSLAKEEAGAEELLRLNWNHWHTENRLHHVRDMTFKEDQSRVRNHGKSQILCSARNTAISRVALADFSNVMEAIGIFGEQCKRALQLMTMKRTE